MAIFQYLEVVQTNFIWKKAEDHFWTDDATVIHSAIEHANAKATPSPPFLVPIDDDPARKESQRLLSLNTKLFLEFSELSPEKEGVLAFANKYGMLTNGELWVRLANKREIFVESLSFWRNEIEELSSAVHIWEALQNNDVSSFEDKFKIDDSKGVIFFKDEATKRLAIHRSKENSQYQRFLSADVKTRLGILLQQHVNKKLNTYSFAFPAEMSANPQVLLDDEGVFRTYLQPQTLLSAIWVQFLQALTGESRYKKCDYEPCGRWEDVSKLSKNWKHHQECGNKKRQATHREKVRKGGLK